MLGAAGDVIWLTGGTGVAWAEFDPAWYLARYPCIRQVLTTDDPEAVLQFYRVTGQQTGHSPNLWFDEAWYLQRYPDAAAAVSGGEYASGFDEYCRVGQKWRSPHWLYDDWLYTFLYQQQTGLLLDDEFLAAGGFCNRYDHYLQQGSREGRVAHLLFDPAYYRAGLLVSEGEVTPEGATADRAGAFGQYLRTIEVAAAEARTSDYFDPHWYLKTYDNVAAAIGNVWLCALHHYLANATPTAFDPVPEFSETYYLHQHADVAAIVAEGGLRNGYQHFLTNGVFELRSPHESIDCGPMPRRMRSC